MPTTRTKRGSNPAASTTPRPRVDATLQLSTQTVAWLANHSRTRQFVGSVWDKLTELEQAGHHPGAIDALRHVLSQATFIHRDVTWQDVAGTAVPRVPAP